MELRGREFLELCLPRGGEAESSRKNLTISGRFKEWVYWGDEDAGIAVRLLRPHSFNLSQESPLPRAFDSWAGPGLGLPRVQKPPLLGTVLNYYLPRGE